MILSGDLGGTTTTLALWRTTPDRDAPMRLQLVREQGWRSGEHERFEPLLEQFLAPTAAARVDAACLGAAGPVRDGRCAVTNLPWVLDAEELGSASRIPRFEIVNDLVAHAEAIPHLSPAEKVSLRGGGREATGIGTRLLLAVGTGLGVATLPQVNNEPPLILPSEAGHSLLAGRDAREDHVVRWLRERHGHSTVEQVISGPGLVQLHQALSSLRGTPEAEKLEPALLVERARSGDPPAKETLDLFLSWWGAITGNLAVITLATGGVDLGGGLPARLLPELLGGPFLDSFALAGPLHEWLEQTPVHVVTNQRTALLGAALRARRAAASDYS